MNAFVHLCIISCLLAVKCSVLGNDYAGGYLSDLSSDWAMISGRIHQPKCIDIPTNLSLCRDIGYETMRLPNLLEHDTLSEVTQQARSWVPLLGIQCHPDTQLFLCSLFSPVCLDRPIYPCRSLCEGVKKGCEERMNFYGFPWPEMLRCDKFPLDQNLCIAQVNHVKPKNTCSACRHPNTFEGIMDGFCRSGFAIKAKISRIRDDNNGNKILYLKKNKKFYKKTNISKRDKKYLNPILLNGAHCECALQTQDKSRYIIMGNKTETGYTVSYISLWEKNKDFRRATRAMKKGNVECKNEILQLANTNTHRKRTRPSEFRTGETSRQIGNGPRKIRKIKNGARNETSKTSRTRTMDILLHRTAFEMLTNNLRMQT
ncbi:hypothetical protein ScPMuIL_015789 [Solemya velum]